MKKSLNAWTLPASLPFETVFRQVKDAGFDGIELNLDAPSPGSCHSLTVDMTSERLADIKAMADAVGLPIVSVSTSLYAGKLGVPTVEAKAYAEKILEKQLFCAKALGGDGILVVPGASLDEYPLETVFRTVNEVFAEMRDVISGYGIKVGLENVWNGYFTSPYDMCRQIDAIGQEQVGAYFDIGNVVAFSNPIRWIEVLGSRIKKVHIKGFCRKGGLNTGGEWCDLPKTSVDVASSLKVLAKAGYDGYVTGEVFPEKGKEYPDMTVFYREVANDLETAIHSF